MIAGISSKSRARQAKKEVVGSPPASTLSSDVKRILGW
jgi:hypothetical protein